MLIKNLYLVEGVGFYLVEGVGFYLVEGFIHYPNETCKWVYQPSMADVFNANNFLNKFW